MAAITLQKPAEAQEKTSNFINMCCGCFGAEDAKNKKLSLTDKYKQLPRVGAYNDMQPIFVFSKRWVQPDNKQIYDQFHDQAANYMLTSKDIQNVKMVCHWWDSKNPNMCWDLQWFGDFEAFYQHADMSNQKTKATIMNWVSSSNYTNSIVYMIRSILGRSVLPKFCKTILDEKRAIAHFVFKNIIFSKTIVILKSIGL